MKRSVSIAAVVALAVAVLAGVAVNRSQAAATAKPAHAAVCTLSPKLSFNPATGAASATGSCRLAGHSVKPAWSYQWSTLDATAPAGYTCSTGQGAKPGFTIGPKDAYRAVVNVALKAAAGRSKPVYRRYGLALDSRSDLDCGRYTDATIPPVSAVCDFGVYPGIENSCGNIQFRKTPASPVIWATKPVIQGNVVTAGHLLSVSGVCRPTPVGGPSTPPGISILQRNNWRCGAGVNAYTTIDIWLVYGTNSCLLPGSTISVMKFSVPSDWGGTLKLAWPVDTYGDQNNLPEAFEWSTAYLKLSGSVDGCQALGLPETPNTNG